MSVFFIADTHFHHKNIIKYCNRPFENAYQMNKALIKNWNLRVSKEDTVYVLGDFAFCGSEELKKLVRKLNGTKYLILGNHDKGYQRYLDAGFKKVYDCPIIIDNFWILSHKPMFVNESMPYVNIFGHVHDNPTYASYGPNFFCVSADRINFTPISFKEIEDRLEYCHANDCIVTLKSFITKEDIYSQMSFSEVFN